LIFTFVSNVVIDAATYPPHIYNTKRGIFILLFGKKTAEQEIRGGLPALFPRLWRYGLILAANQDDAMDLAQTTCLRALENASSYQAGTRLDSWLFKMEQRLWLNELRARSVRRGGGLQAAEDIDIPDPRPDQNTNFFVRQVLSSIYELPEAQRAVVVLVYVEGFKYAEAAEILSVPAGTIMSRLAAARKTVSDRMTQESKATK
jgi:RNA polymerase sigma-70 factor (ECF subfamily)